MISFDWFIQFLEEILMSEVPILLYFSDVGNCCVASQQICVKASDRTVLRSQFFQDRSLVVGRCWKDQPTISVDAISPIFGWVRATIWMTYTFLEGASWSLPNNLEQLETCFCFTRINNKTAKTRLQEKWRQGLLGKTWRLDSCTTSQTWRKHISSPALQEIQCASPGFSWLPWFILRNASHFTDDLGCHRVPGIFPKPWFGNAKPVTPCHASWCNRSHWEADTTTFSHSKRRRGMVMVEKNRRASRVVPCCRTDVPHVNRWILIIWRTDKIIGRLK